nr:hypothetical protein [Stenotrophomonas maltophilia]
MSSPALPWNGTLLLDAHVAVLQGHAGGSASHAHYAHQLLLSDGTPWQVEVDGVRQQGQRLWLPSFQPHAILSAPEAGCTVFLEPRMPTSNRSSSTCTRCRALRWNCTTGCHG